MEPFESRLEEMLLEIDRLRQSSQDDGSCRSHLENFGQKILKMAAEHKDVYQVVQDNEDCIPGEPVYASPGVAEWQSFGQFMHGLRIKDVSGIGVALITLPQGMPYRMRPGEHEITDYGRRFTVQDHSVNPDYIGIGISKENALFQGREPWHLLETKVNDIQSSPFVTSTSQIVSRFEKWDFSQVWETPIYVADKDVATAAQRLGHNLSEESCIYPLSSNVLNSTLEAISGIHTPLLYTSEDFGTPFALHVEDMNLISLNVLLWGAPKVWIVIAPHHRHKLEQVIQSDLQVKASFRVCDQWVRHHSIYIPTVILDRYKIHYCQFIQQVGQVVITFPFAYHQGFNSGKNVAEAVNFGDKSWSVIEVKNCAKGVCGYSGVSKKAFMPRGDIPQQPPTFLPLVDPEMLIEASIQQSKKIRMPESALPNPATPSLPGSTTAPPLESTERRESLRKKPDPPILVPSSTVPRPRAKLSTALARRAKKTSSAATPSPVADDSSEQNQLIPARVIDQKWLVWEQNQRSLGEDLKLRPTTLFETLGSRTIGKEQESRFLVNTEIDTIINLVAAFGSADAFSQLLDIYKLLRGGTTPSVSGTALQPESQDGSEISAELANAARELRLLKSIFTSEAWNSMRTRFCLARFVKEFDTEVESRRSIQKAIKNKQVDPESVTVNVKGNIATAVYKDIMRLLHPHLSVPEDSNDSSISTMEYNHQYRILSDLHKHGKHWFIIANELGWSSLALFPCGGRYGTSNSTIRDLSKDLFNVFFDTLKMEKGEWLNDVGDHLGVIMRAAVDGAVGTQLPHLILETVDTREIISCGDQSESLRRLASSSPGPE